MGITGEKGSALPHHIPGHLWEGDHQCALIQSPQHTWIGCPRLWRACRAKEAETRGLEIERYIVEGMGSSERRADTNKQTNKAQLHTVHKQNTCTHTLHRLCVST